MPMRASDGAPCDTQRRTSASSDSAYDAMMQAYVRTAREEREARRTHEALNVAASALAPSRAASTW
jgi:hypothetical protein